MIQLELNSQPHSTSPSIFFSWFYGANLICSFLVTVLACYVANFGIVEAFGYSSAAGSLTLLLSFLLLVPAASLVFPLMNLWMRKWVRKFTSNAFMISLFTLLACSVFALGITLQGVSVRGASFWYDGSNIILCTVLFFNFMSSLAINLSYPKFQAKYRFMEDIKVS